PANRPEQKKPDESPSQVKKSDVAQGEMKDAAKPKGEPSKVAAADPPSKPKEPEPESRPAPPPKVLTSGATGMKLVLIEPGEFLMGSDDSDKDAEDDESVKKADKKEKHLVRITKPFYLGETEVTVGQFRKFVEATNYRTDAESDGHGGGGWNAQ